MPRKKITPKQYNEMAAGVRLSAHEKLCAERMKNLITSIDRLEKKVDALQDNVSKGKGIVAVLVFLGSIVAGVLGYLNFK
jgi:phage terminase large subunit-like protein|tara:strand:+ start:103 stop:342 length:240 start_codon:yes stop_codon:yes gene_type:complete